ncbi:hypothetical protein [Dactylosporangium fulvum]|uniref:Uncharacterized protein n=1 Tax=Dactylosporangium fulvum TaxID=53359 RepID=A0ABY5WAJ7_9ACTN|nr:hypothetical protein [Dactylosporangium fulvum]UWP87082.1 hypothetical protein Dfulv_23705 [Dactylosporangium fulvum]
MTEHGFTLPGTPHYHCCPTPTSPLRSWPAPAMHLLHGRFKIDD